jgi:uncharacterized protein (TIGR00369 family)
MSAFKPADADFERRVRESFERQGAMRLLGARLGAVEAGRVDIELPFRDELSQQHGFFHAGITSTIADSAGGYAGYTLFPADASVLTVEFKINLVAPAHGEKLIATGRVKKPGRTLTICEFEVLVFRGGNGKTCALGLQTLMCVQARADMARPG